MDEVGFVSISRIQNLKKGVTRLLLGAVIMSNDAAARFKSKKRRIRFGTTVSSRIGIAFLIAGISSLVFSVRAGSQILALIGLGLTFWGALFLLLSPVGYVKGRHLYGAAVALYATIDRIIADFEVKGNGQYIPPYPKGAYLPEHLKGLRDIVVFISAEKEETFPSVEEMAQGKFLLKYPRGVIVSPPGMGLLQEIENEIHTDMANMNLQEIFETLPRVILENFNLAKDITISIEENQVTLRIEDSLYKDLYRVEDNFQSVKILGCPIASAIACVLAKAYGKPITIIAHEIAPGGSTIQTQYQIEQGPNE